MTIASLTDATPEPAATAGVYLVAAAELFAAAPPWSIAGRPVRAFAPHPDIADVLYVTTEHPETLGSLSDGHIEVP